MICTINEYRQYSLFTKSTKEEHGLWVAKTIINKITNDKKLNLDEFIKSNKTYQDFLKKNDYLNVSKHFGKPLTEDEYIQILENLKKVNEKKEEFNKENIGTKKLGDEEYNVFTGEENEYFIKNNKKDQSIEEQLQNLQPTNNSFQTIDAMKNTENMFKELEKRKETLNLNYLYEINSNLLNDEEKMLYQIAIEFQKSQKDPIRVDLKRGVIVTKENELFKIERKNGEILITSEDSKDIINEDSKENSNSIKKEHVKSLKPSPNTIYSN